MTRAFDVSERLMETEVPEQCIVLARRAQLCRYELGSCVASSVLALVCFHTVLQGARRQDHGLLEWKETSKCVSWGWTLQDRPKSKNLLRYDVFDTVK